MLTKRSCQWLVAAGSAGSAALSTWRRNGARILESRTARPHEANCIIKLAQESSPYTRQFLYQLIRPSQLIRK